jgi:hypothetical protein
VEISQNYYVENIVENYLNPCGKYCGKLHSPNPNLPNYLKISSEFST